MFKESVINPQEAIDVKGDEVSINLEQPIGEGEGENRVASEMLNLFIDRELFGPKARENFETLAHLKNSLANQKPLDLFEAIAISIHPQRREKYIALLKQLGIEQTQ